jgi:hypothetical protein
MGWKAANYSHKPKLSPRWNREFIDALSKIESLGTVRNIELNQWGIREFWTPQAPALASERAIVFDKIARLDDSAGQPQPGYGCAQRTTFAQRAGRSFFWAPDRERVAPVVGFVPLQSNTTYCPEPVLRMSSSLIPPWSRPPGPAIYRTYAWSDRDSRPMSEQHKVSYREFSR